MKMHETFWAAPAPLWLAHAGSGPRLAHEAFGEPALLRFAADSFMDDFIALLEKDPARIADLVARPETWRGLLATPQVEAALLPEARRSSARQRLLSRLRTARERPARVAGVKSALADARAPASPLLKLYQPAHQRYYLVSACLVCGIPGLPDKAVDAGRAEFGRFVLRRLLPPAGAAPGVAPPASDADVGGWDEHAYVVGAGGAGWRRLDDPTRTVPGEEMLPLFPVSYGEDDGRRRRLFAGLIPVARRDAYLAAATTDSTGAISDATTRKTARKILFRSQVAEPWKAIISRALRLREAGVIDKDAGDLARTAADARQQLMTASWYVLLDFAEYLQTYLKDVWAAVADPALPVPEDTNRQKLLTALRDTKPTSAYAGRVARAGYAASTSLAEALRAAAAWKEDLEAVQSSFEFVSAPAALADAGRAVPSWPDFLFPLADFFYDGTAPAPQADALSVLLPTDALTAEETGTSDMLQADTGGDLAAQRATIDQLAALLVKALPVDDPAAPVPAVPVAAGRTLLGADGVFRVRCLLARPHCGELQAELVSAPSRAFRLAAFFDPDAPARPVRIGLPLDTTPAGLRKFDKNTAFEMSNILCGQVQRFKGITLGDLVRSVLPWPLHKDLSVPDSGPCKTGGGDAAGMLCTLSIPIITICALILLLIMVSLLDLIFRWIPWFIMCFPIPGLRGKK